VRGRLTITGTPAAWLMLAPGACGQEGGFWNGLTAWIFLIVHVFGGWEDFPFYNEIE
jgi:hypothetical protein